MWSERREHKRNIKYLPSGIKRCKDALLFFFFKSNLLLNNIMFYIKNKQLKTSESRRCTFTVGDTYLRGKRGSIRTLMFVEVS